MNLPKDSSNFDDLLKKMDVAFRPFIEPEVMDRLVTKGIDIGNDEIEHAPNGTLEYQGQKVILYIRDAKGSLPKYHIVKCYTLEDMEKKGKYKRYVVTRRMDGGLLLNFADNLHRDDPEMYRLDICKNCLWKLNMRYDYPIDAFPLTDWFNAIDPNYQPPPIDTLSGPRTTPSPDSVSNYPPDWNLRSLQCREGAAWKCEECSIDLISARRFLHAHHLRGTRYNRPEDLIALCIGCHAEQPYHSMKSLPDYLEFMDIYGYLWKQLTRK